MKIWALVLVGFSLSFFAVCARAGEERFSAKITPDQRAEAGIDKLSAEQISILDALVQREEAFISTEQNAATLPTARFSERLAPDKRRSAGLTLLSPTELANLDVLVSGALVKKVSTTMSSARSVAVKPESVRLKPEIHGEIGFSYGVGSHGYSEVGGYIVVNYTDPEKGYSVTVAYSETRVKGGYFGPYCGDPLLEPRGTFLERSTSARLSKSWPQ
ncbi:MAG TPA: hypothetical protein VKC60_11320 [Opitutaceae bacterium]|nr:hypothetical protein [Opitutaceae bacterium]